MDLRLWSNGACVRQGWDLRDGFIEVDLESTYGFYYADHNADSPPNDYMPVGWEEPRNTQWNRLCHH